MLPFARRAAHEIEERLLDDTGFAERVMMRRFLQERSGGKHPMLVANSRVVIANTAAERLVRPEDEPQVRLQAERVMARTPTDVVEIMLSSGGRTVAVRCEPIFDGTVAVGVVMHLAGGAAPTRSPGVGARRPDRHRASHREPRRPGSDQPADRRAGVRVPSHGGFPPAVDLPQGQRDLAHRTDPSDRRRRSNDVTVAGWREAGSFEHARRSSLARHRGRIFVIAHLLGAPGLASRR